MMRFLGLLYMTESIKTDNRELDYKMKLKMNKIIFSDRIVFKFLLFQNFHITSCERKQK